MSYVDHQQLKSRSMAVWICTSNQCRGIEQQRLLELNPRFAQLKNWTKRGFIPNNLCRTIPIYLFQYEISTARVPSKTIQRIPILAQILERDPDVENPLTDCECPRSFSREFQNERHVGNMFKRSTEGSSRLAEWPRV